MLFGGQHYAVEQRLQAAEAALEGSAPNDSTNDLVGRIASIRATLGIIQDDVDTIVIQSRRALDYLHPDNLLVRTATTYTLGYAYQLQGNRAAASQAFTEVIVNGTTHGNSIYTIAATISLAQLQEADTQLSLATRTYRRVLDLAGDPPQPIATEAYLGLARIAYQWNDLDAAVEHGQRCFDLTRQMEGVATFPSYAVLVAHIRLAQGEVPGAATILDEAEAFIRQHNFTHHMPGVAAAQVLTLLRQGSVAAAAQLAGTQDFPLSHARVSLAQGDPSSALAAIEPELQQADARDWHDERLKAMVLQALAYQAQDEQGAAVRVLGEALALAEPEGYVRVFLDEGPPMARLLADAFAQGIMPDCSGRLMVAFDAEEIRATSNLPAAQPLAEPLSPREMDVLRLIAEGRSNREIGERLYLALDTVKGHNRKIFGKLGVRSRTEAIARALELGLL
jgi:LuxR family maltose regulon positive regulatory protein